MIINIFGGGGSGKTTLQMALLKDPRFINVIPYTTRKMRSGEENGVHYHFVTKQFFKNKTLVLKRFALGHSYGYKLRDLHLPRIGILTVDLEGLLELHRLNIETKVIYLNLKEEERVQRMTLRGDTKTQILNRISLDREKIVHPKIDFPVMEIIGGTIAENATKIKNFAT